MRTLLLSKHASGEVQVTINEQDIALFYEYESGVVKQLVDANIIRNDEIENYLRESGYNPVSEMVEEENEKLKEENKRLKEDNEKLLSWWRSLARSVGRHDPEDPARTMFPAKHEGGAA